VSSLVRYVTLCLVGESFGGANGNGRKGPLFSMFSRIGLCVGLKILWVFSGQWDRSI
jgi:hypothetical protein